MRVVDLFAGCGGMSRGFVDADFDIALAVEMWAPARDVYEQNFSGKVSGLDLSDVASAVSKVRHVRPDLVMGGPPCQDFSPAGPRVEGDKAALTVKFAEIVAEVQPKWFVLENVHAAQKSATWVAAKKILQDAGYGLSEAVLNAAHFGVPQLRKRFFAVGKLGASEGFLDAALTEKKNNEPLTVRGYLGDELGVPYYYRHPRNWGRKGIFSIDEPAPTVRSTNRRVPPGYKAHPNDAGPLELARPLTAVQRARIQTFDQSFKFDGFETWKDIMIANAVPVKLAQHIAETIKTHEKQECDSDSPDFRDWLATSAGFTIRTASNVLSRLRRAEKILGRPISGIEAELVIGRLEDKDYFCGLSPSVRSQLRRAIRLRQAFVRLQQR